MKFEIVSEITEIEIIAVEKGILCQGCVRCTEKAGGVSSKV